MPKPIYTFFLGAQLILAKADLRSRRKYTNSFVINASFLTFAENFIQWTNLIVVTSPIWPS